MAEWLADAPGYVGILREPGPLDGAIVAHASLHPSYRTGSGEVAFAVADELQGHGIGRRLITSVLEEARALDLQSVTATLLADNTPMRHLLLHAGIPVATHRFEDGVEEIVLGLSRDLVPRRQGFRAA